MKKVIQYITSYKNDHLNWYELAFALLFMASFAWFNYGTTILRDYWYTNYWSGNIYRFFFVLYFSPIALGYLSYSFFNKDWSIWKNPKFWLLILLAGATFAGRSSIHLVLEPLYASWSSFEHIAWLKAVVGTVVRSGMLLTPLAIYWYFVDRKNQPYYGFTLKNFDTKPYFMMLLIMLPLIILASTQSDFLGAYPRGQKFESLDIHNAAQWKYFGLYELIYGLDFISIEFFFRGFMVLAFVGILGPKAILPMAMFYVVIHWGKPAGELVSSFFGGTLLGIIAYYSKSILGGIIVHMGIAWMMEIGALIGNYFNT